MTAALSSDLTMAIPLSLLNCQIENVLFIIIGPCFTFLAQVYAQGDNHARSKHPYSSRSIPIQFRTHHSYNTTKSCPLLLLILLLPASKHTSNITTRTRHPINNFASRRLATVRNPSDGRVGRLSARNVGRRITALVVLALPLSTRHAFFGR